MADDSPVKTSNITSSLGKKLGPLPVWVWGVGAGALVLAYFIWNNNSIAGASGSSSDTTTGDSGETLPDVVGSSSGASTTTPTRGTSTNPVTYDNNAQWVAAVVAHLMLNGYSPLDVQVVLDKYITGKSLGVADQKVVNLAIAYAGIPPDGIESTPVQDIPVQPTGPIHIGKPVLPRPSTKDVVIGVGAAKPIADVPAIANAARVRAVK
jgi:hypothetical protein